jgi:predicted nucleotidyltransferase
MTEDAAAKRDSPILAKFRMALASMYGERLERVVLYGSRARGNAGEDSDYDVAVFLKDLSDRWAEADKIAVAATDILRETGAVIHAMPYPAGAYRERSPLMHEIRQEGFDL